MAGGSGDDRILVTGTGSLTLKTFNAASASIEIWEGNGKAVVGTSSADTLNFSALTAVSGVSYIDGGKGNDVINGSQFADDLRGGAGNDTLTAGAGDDRVVGGEGVDLLRGGEGADTFVFAESGSKHKDTIFDYDFAAGDRIDLSALLDANFGPSSVVSDFVRLTASGSNLLLQIDGNGTAGGVTFVDVAVFSAAATAGVDQVLVDLEQQAQVLAA
jgi:Ca2+-binding RTX toxin-like protein